MISTDEIMHDGKTLTEIIRLHKCWRNGEDGGVRADLGGADLRFADLSGADLSGSDLRGADLRGADLSGAYLSGAYLSGADLSGSDLSGAYLRGAEKIEIKKIITIGPIGSRSDYLTVYYTDNKPVIKAGCFFGDTDLFRKKVADTHKDNAQCFIEYNIAITAIEAWDAQLKQQSTNEQHG